MNRLLATLTLTGVLFGSTACEYSGRNSENYHMTLEDFKALEKNRAFRLSGPRKFPLSKPEQETTSNASKSVFLGSNLTKPQANPRVMGYSIPVENPNLDSQHKIKITEESLEEALSKKIKEIWKPEHQVRNTEGIFYHSYDVFDLAEDVADLVQEETRDFVRKDLKLPGADLQYKKGGLKFSISPHDVKRNIDRTKQAYFWVGKDGRSYRAGINVDY